jgi:hypothetical protein
MEKLEQREAYAASGAFSRFSTGAEVRPYQALKADGRLLNERQFLLENIIINSHFDLLAAATVLSLSSFYLELPRGNSFLEYSDFRQAYEALRVATRDFRTLDRHAIHEVFKMNGLVLVLLRCIVGLTPGPSGF